jgi:hypothetical protein
MGFRVPEDLRKIDDILDVSVGTDPTLALQTRRGTGFYKVPSLRGLWYRNGFGHNGQAYTLEEWLDPARLRNDYVPKGYHLGPGPIKSWPPTILSGHAGFSKGHNQRPRIRAGAYP